jgi:hypothetical protein
MMDVLISNANPKPAVHLALAVINCLLPSCVGHLHELCRRQSNKYCSFCKKYDLTLFSRSYGGWPIIAMKECNVTTFLSFVALFPMCHLRCSSALLLFVTYIRDTRGPTALQRHVTVTNISAGPWSAGPMFIHSLYRLDLPDIKPKNSE